MYTSLESQIRDCLRRYLANELSLRAFQERFVPLAWNVQGGGSPGAEEAANEIELRLAEFSSGHWTEPDLRELLDRLLQTPQLAAFRPVTVSLKLELWPFGTSGRRYSLPAGLALEAREVVLEHRLLTAECLEAEPPPMTLLAS